MSCSADGRPPGTLRPRSWRWWSRFRRLRTPFFPQSHAAECGAACLGIVLAHFGRWVPLSELRRTCGVSRDGCSAADIVRAAEHYGLRARGWRREPEQLRRMALPVNPVLGVPPLRRPGRIRRQLVPHQRSRQRPPDDRPGGVPQEVHRRRAGAGAGTGLHPERGEAGHPPPAMAMAARPARIARPRDRVRIAAGGAHHRPADAPRQLRRPRDGGERRRDRRRADRRHRGPRRAVSGADLAPATLPATDRPACVGVPGRLPRGKAVAAADRLLPPSKRRGSGGPDPVRPTESPPPPPVTSPAWPSSS